jgi:hypothetical protein
MVASLPPPVRIADGSALSACDQFKQRASLVLAYFDNKIR